MTVKAELQFVTDAASEANKAAVAVARFRSELEKLQSIGGSSNVGAPLPGGKGGGSGIDGIQARASAQQSAIAQKSAAQVAAIEATSNADSAASGHRIAEQYQKDRNAILVAGAKASHDEQASELAHAHKLAQVDQKGTVDTHRLRVKGEQDRARIEAKNSGDLAKIEAKRKVDESKDARKAAIKLATIRPSGSVKEETTSGVGGAAKAILEGKGIKGALGAFGGHGAKIAAVGELALSVGRAAFDAAKQIAGISFEFGTAVVGAQAYKEDVTKAFETVRGSSIAADSTMQTALQNADRLGIARANSVGQFLDLATKGFDDAKIKEIQGRLLDITTIDPRANVEGLTKTIGKVAAQGRLTTDILSELSTAGLEQGDVIREIGKTLGKTDVEVIKALSSSGGIRGLGVDPILKAIGAQVGGAAPGVKAAEKARNNLSSLLRRVGEVPQNILFDIDVGSGIDGIKGVLRSILDFFASGSETAKNASRVIGGAFNALISGLTGKDISSDSGGITDFLTDVMDLIEIATPGIKAMGALARNVFTAIAFVAAGTGNILALLSGDFSSLTSFGDDIKTILGASIDNAGLSIVESATSLGSDIVNGLIAGIQGGLSAVGAMASNMGSTVISSVRGALDSHSPARELIKVGLDATTGLAMGGAQGTPMVAGAFSSMAIAGLMAAASVSPLPMAMPFGIGSSGQSSAMTLPGASSLPSFTFAPVITVQVSGNGDNDDIAESIAREVKKLIPGAITAYLQAIGGVKR